MRISSNLNHLQVDICTDEDFRMTILAASPGNSRKHEFELNLVSKSIRQLTLKRIFHFPVSE